MADGSPPHETVNAFVIVGTRPEHELVCLLGRTRNAVQLKRHWRGIAGAEGEASRMARVGAVAGAGRSKPKGLAARSPTLARLRAYVGSTVPEEDQPGTGCGPPWLGLP